MYADEDQQIELDYFCIRKNDIENIDDYSQAEQFAIENVATLLEEWADEINDEVK